mmetsp:Transcript_22338/g.50506  ORF Transcript_22338/g.50506 Transcript_22338/m.50506 type:complete len:282 (+) Transcript_22338:102-947(+)
MAGLSSRLAEQRALNNEFLDIVEEKLMGRNTAGKMNEAILEEARMRRVAASGQTDTVLKHAEEYREKYAKAPARAFVLPVEKLDALADMNDGIIGQGMYFKELREDEERRLAAQRREDQTLRFASDVNTIDALASMNDQIIRDDKRLAFGEAKREARDVALQAAAERERARRRAVLQVGPSVREIHAHQTFMNKVKLDRELNMAREERAPLTQQIEDIVQRTAQLRAQREALADGEGGWTGHKPANFDDVMEAAARIRKKQGGGRGGDPTQKANRGRDHPT